MDIKLTISAAFSFVMIFSIIPSAMAQTDSMISSGTGNPPALDGTIGEAEWVDANSYSGVGAKKAFDIYLKHDNDYFYVGVQVRDNNKHGKDEFTIYFDEGDDGNYGSGSRDEVLKASQEDQKIVLGDGTLSDGCYYPIGWFYMRGGPLGEIDFECGISHHGDCWELEFKIPLQGHDGGSSDYSDVNVTTKNVLGILFSFGNYDPNIGGYNPFSHPAESPIPGTDIGGDPTRWLDLEFDSDSDGLSDNEEPELGTSLNKPDTDGDSLLDGGEVETYQTDPLDASADKDGDGILDNNEILEYGTNQLKLDTDGDCLADNEEIFAHNTDPLKLDTDNDELNDNEEIVRETNPLDPDTDGDNLTDGEEVNTYGSDPLALDTDNDGWNDQVEVKIHGTSPVKADSDGDFWEDPTDPWPTSTFLPNTLIALAVIVCIMGIVWWKRKS